MQYRELGKTGLKVSEIALGGEWLERHNTQECREVILHAEERGINLLDCWMCEPNVRSNIGRAIAGRREKWIIQGHIGSVWVGGQYTRTRDVKLCRQGFEDLLARMETDYIDLGMIHFVDRAEDWEAVTKGPFYDLVQELKNTGRIRHVGMSTHNPDMAKKAVESGWIEVILFSVNPAFDLLPPTDNLDNYFVKEYAPELSGIDPARTELYNLCESKGVALTVMKPYAGGRLFQAEQSPFGTALTPVQCIHYCLTRPGVAAVLPGCETVEQVDAAVAYETATPEERDYASVLAAAPQHRFSQGECTYCGHCKPCPAEIDIAMVNKYYDLALMQEDVPASIREHYRGLAHGADQCIGCRSCEERCPFGVKIAERMEKAAKLFV
ncbi:aldo/keto reductase [Acutalibacter intestini]|uniref:aldo/keto reductase n=1 Tax=Acutalibacter intestini TaxID=3093659 RepID=UPI002AC91C39|nr:aldo/keto reductase [Acutalibacter sp. M00204]